MKSSRQEAKVLCLFQVPKSPWDWRKVIYRILALSKTLEEMALRMVPMAEQLYHKHFIAQAFEEGGIISVISKCHLKNTTPIFLSKPCFFPMLWLSFGQAH